MKAKFAAFEADIYQAEQSTTKMQMGEWRARF